MVLRELPYLYLAWLLELGDRLFAELFSEFLELECCFACACSSCLVSFCCLCEFSLKRGHNLVNLCDCLFHVLSCFLIWFVKAKIVVFIEPMRLPCVTSFIFEWQGLINRHFPNVYTSLSRIEKETWLSHGTAARVRKLIDKGMWRTVCTKRTKCTRRTNWSKCCRRSEAWRTF